MAKTRIYTDAEKAKALAALTANNGNVNGTAKQLGIPRTTLALWEKAFTAKEQAKPELTVLRHKEKRGLAGSLRELAALLIDIPPEQIEAASIRDRMFCAAVAIDKAQLLRGKATTIAGTHAQETNEQRERLRILRDKVHARRLGLHDPGGAPGTGPAQTG
jgi:transposase-like protein